MAMMQSRHIRTIICLWLWILSFHNVSSTHGIRWVASSLLLPPVFRQKAGAVNSFKEDCRVASDKNGAFVWGSDITEGYQVATYVFKSLVNRKTAETGATLWFPSFHNSKVLQTLATVLNENSKELGGITASATTWPRAPANKLEITWSSESNSPADKAHIDESQLQDDMDATEAWVENTLARLELCPHAISMQQSAVGLGEEGVKEGPIAIRHASRMHPREDNPACALAAAFWDGVTELATTSEEELSTILLLAPSSPYDEDFQGFIGVCDKILEPCVQATRATDVIGRAWFHPLYDAASVGHSQVLPGHAVPASMVRGFMDKQLGGPSDKPNDSTIAKANDAVRWTPHATINLLRRSQLNAAKRMEAASPNPIPNAIYVRNAMKIISDGKLLES